MPVQPFIPPDWTWVYDLVVGQGWPQANEDSLRNCAKAWTDAHGQLASIAQDGDVAAQNVGSSVQSVSSDQFAEYWKQYIVAVKQLSDQSDGLAKQLAQFADQTEFTKLSIDVQIVILVIQLIIDAATAIITAGGSTAEGIAAAFMTRLTIRGMLEQLLRAVLAAVLPDVITQTIMLAQGHRSSYDIGETLQAAQMGVIGGAIGIGLGALGNKIGLTQALTSKGVLGGLLNAGIHGGVTADLTNAATGLADAGEQALFDPGAQQTYGMAQEKSSQNPFLAALNGAFTGMLFHGVHETGTALGGGNHFEPTPFTLDNGQSFNAVQIRDGTGSNYALFDDNMKLVGTGSLDNGGNLSVTPNQGDAFSAQVTNLPQQPAPGADQPLALGGGNGNDGTTPPGPSDDPTRLAGADQQPANPVAGELQPQAQPEVPAVTPGHEPGSTGIPPETPAPQMVFQPETQAVEPTAPLADQTPFGSSQVPAGETPTTPPASAPFSASPGVPGGGTSDVPYSAPPGIEGTGAPGQVPGSFGPEPTVPGPAIGGPTVPGTPPEAPGATQLASYGPVIQEPGLADWQQPTAKLPTVATPGSAPGQGAAGGGIPAVEPVPPGYGTVAQEPELADWQQPTAKLPSQGAPGTAAAPGGHGEITGQPSGPLSPEQLDNITGTPTQLLSWGSPRVFTDPTEAKAYAEGIWGPSFDQLSPEQQDALRAYTGETIASHDPPSYQAINEFLRGRIPARPAILDSIARIDEALRLQPVPEDVVVNRTTNSRAFLGPDGRPIENLDDLQSLVGSVHESPRYQSTHFGVYHPGGEEVALHLMVPEGTPALYLGENSYNPTENELLLGRGLAFQVDRVWSDGQTWHVQAHVLEDVTHPGEPGLAVVPDDEHGLRLPGVEFTRRMETYADQPTQPLVDFRGLTPDEIVERESATGQGFGSGSEHAQAIGEELAGKYQNAPSSKVSIGQTRAVAADLNARGLSQDDAITAWKAFYGSAMDGYGPAYRYANGDVVIAAANGGFTDVIVIDPHGFSAPGTTTSNDILGGMLGEVSPRLPGPDWSADSMALGPSTLAAENHGGQATGEAQPVLDSATGTVDQPPLEHAEAARRPSSPILDALKVELVPNGEAGAGPSGMSHHGNASHDSPVADRSAELRTEKHVAAGSSSAHEWPAGFREVTVPEHPEWAGKIRVKDGFVVIGDDPELARGTEQPASDGTVIIKAHGQGGEVFLGQESQESISFRDPAIVRMLTEAGLRPGHDVVLACCEAGLDGGAADQLAAMLPGTSVIAADTAVWDDHQGGLFAASEEVVNGMPVPTLLADENGAFHPDGIWEAHRAGTETTPLSESDPRHPPAPAGLNPSVTYAELRGLRDFGYKGDQFGARAPDSPLAEVVDAVASHDNAAAVTPDPALTGQWLLDSSVDVSLTIPTAQRDELNVALRDYANELLDRAAGATTFQQLLDDRRTNVDLLTNAMRRQQQALRLPDQIASWTEKVDDATARIAQLAPERAELTRLDNEFKQVTADLRQASRDLDAAKQAGQPTLEPTKRFNDLTDKSRELQRAMQGIRRQLDLANDDLTNAQKNLRAATTRLAKALAAASASPRAVHNMLDETAAMNRNPGLPVGRQRLPLAGSNSSTELLQVHSIPVEIIWHGDGSPGLAYVPFRDGNGSYPSLLGRLTDLRATYDSRVPSGASFDARYASALLDLAKVPAGQTQIPPSLRTLADDIYSPQAVTAFLNNPDWSGGDQIGTFFHDAAAMMVLQVGVEGARNPSALVTNLMTWDMVANGKLDLDRALGYLNVMGPGGSVRIGTASDDFSGLKGPAAIDDAVTAIANSKGVVQELRDPGNVRELIERFPAIRSDTRLFDSKGDLLPGYNSQLLARELTRAYVSQSVAEMEHRQRQIVTLYAATMRPQTVPEDSNGIAMLNNFLYGAGSQNQPRTAVTLLMNNLMIRLGW